MTGCYTRAYKKQIEDSNETFHFICLCFTWGTHGDGGKIVILLFMLFMLFMQGGGFHYILN